MNEYDPWDPFIPGVDWSEGHEVEWNDTSNGWGHEEVRLAPGWGEGMIGPGYASKSLPQEALDHNVIAELLVSRFTGGNIVSGRLISTGHENPQWSLQLEAELSDWDHDQLARALIPDRAEMPEAEGTWAIEFDGVGPLLPSSSSSQ